MAGLRRARRGGASVDRLPKGDWSYRDKDSSRPMPAAHHINNGDETDVAHSRHVHTTLSIEFPLVMRCAFRLDRWDGQWTQLLIAARKFLGVEQRRDAGATWQEVICPAEINAEFRQQGSRPPTGMRSTQVQDGIMHFPGKSAQRSGGGATHLGVEAGAPVMLTQASPFAHRPDRATERSRNLWVGLSNSGSFSDVQPLLKGSRLSAPYHRASNRTASSSIR